MKTLALALLLGGALPRPLDFTASPAGAGPGSPLGLFPGCLRRVVS